jgi:hypothetical protein
MYIAAHLRARVANSQPAVHSEKKHTDHSEYSQSIQLSNFVSIQQVFTTISMVTTK